MKRISKPCYLHYKKLMQYTFYTLLLALIGLQVYAQAYYQTLSLPVEKYGTTLTNAWAGGLDAPQFSPADLDGDGTNDLFVFDRNGSRAFAFINKGNGNYSYAPHIIAALPELENWALMRDFNKDGIPDIFCWANSGLKVFRGKRINNALSFEIQTELLTYTDYFSINYPKINLYVLTDDIPGILDVNGDGDMDILVFGNLLNPSVPQFYENQSVEQGFGADSLVFDSYNLDQCWGKFIESSTTNAISIGYCKTGGIQGTPAGRHAGSTLCPYDEDGDGDIDLLLGDITYNTMIMLRNGGDNTEANILSYDSIFPNYNTSIDMPIFPAGYIADVDNDGKNDLLVSPNARTAIRNVKNVLFYKNTGSNTNYVFNYQTDSFLVHTMLDFGSDAKVAAFDYNNDGLMDLVIGNAQYYIHQGSLEKSQLALLQNVGTTTQPAFKLVTDNYENIAQYLLKTLQPTFGDLDGDGKADMLLGDYAGNVHFLKNTGTTTAQFPALTTPQYFDLDASVLAAPFIYDVDGDNDNDIICGRKDGSLNWYINFGSKQNPQFHKDSVKLKWGNVNLKGIYEVDGLSQPVLTKHNDSLFLYSGSNRGAIFKFYIPGNDIRNESFSLIDSNLLGISVGKKSTIAFADFNGDSIPDLVVGNSLGGLDFYSSKLIDVAVHEAANPKNYEWNIFPNPTSGSVVITTESNEAAKAEIFSITGEKVLERTFFQAEKINTASLAGGIYLVKLHNHIKRLAVVK